ncbi:MAG: ELWxxDGT repeat protein, partial [Acidimicrobiales bacterium]
FGAVGRITAWSVYGGGFSGSRQVTPVILRLRSDGRYEITGIGAPRAVLTDQGQAFEFDLASGRDGVGPGFYFGWKDGSAAADNAGAIGYALGGETVSWLGGSHAAAGDFAVGTALRPLRQDFKTYAVNASVVRGVVLEFDLGQFLDFAGSPESIAAARLVLDTPGAAAPVPAPTSVFNITSSGGKVYFTGHVQGKGIELWVTDGTIEGTRLVKDIIPGATGSNPQNLVDVGGTLYFTANQGINKSELWKSDGTALGTFKVADIPYFPFNFTPVLGTATLLATGAGPANGRPAADYSFGIDVVLESGQVRKLQVVLPSALTSNNSTLTALVGDINSVLAGTVLPGAGFAPGALTAAVSGTRILFTGSDPAMVQLVLRGAAALG